MRIERTDISFSRFEINRASRQQLPIFPITQPGENGEVGVVIAGDYVAQDLVHHLEKVGTRERWLVISATQSDIVPTHCTDVDLNLFSNHSGEGEYLASPAANVAYSSNGMNDGHFTDPEIFYPVADTEKKWDILYAAKYYPTKKTELLLDAAALDPELQVALVGWPVVSERKAAVSKAYREHILTGAAELPNVTVFDNPEDEQHVHTNADGSIVVGKYTKGEMRNLFYAKALSVLFLSETTEGVNRTCTEAMCCGVPVLVAPTRGGLDRLVTDKTGVMIERSPQGIVDGVKSLRASQTLSPRAGFLEVSGKAKANQRLREIIGDVSKNQGRIVNWEGVRDYGGDPWTPHEVYYSVTG